MVELLRFSSHTFYFKHHVMAGKCCGNNNNTITEVGIKKATHSRLKWEKFIQCVMNFQRMILVVMSTIYK